MTGRNIPFPNKLLKGRWKKFSDLARFDVFLYHPGERLDGNRQVPRADRTNNRIPNRKIYKDILRFLGVVSIVLDRFTS